MKLSTPVPVLKIGKTANYNNKTVFIGSCFAVHIAQKFKESSLPYCSNPFGVLFNPMAIEALVSMAVNKQLPEPNTFLETDGIWKNFTAHSQVYESAKEGLGQLLEEQLLKLNDSLLSASHLVITLGSAWGYRHIASDRIVANCHKQPTADFTKELLSPDAVAKSVLAIIKTARSLNPDLVVIGSVSPVRHIKDGMVENAQSKAHLLSGLHQAFANQKDCYYFPSYEILMDQLRDYRFYKADLIHPNEQAIQIIWERFLSSCFTQDTLAIIKQVAQLKTSMAHRPIHPESPSHKVFKKSLQANIEAFKQEFPHIEL